MKSPSPFWARLTRRVGVAVVTAGPGVTDSVRGVVNAYQADSPLFVIGGQAPIAEYERGTLQEMNHVELMRHNLPIVSVIGNDAAWGQIRGPQIHFLGEERAVATSLALTRYELMVKALGGHGEFVTRPE